MRLLNYNTKLVFTPFQSIRGDILINVRNNGLHIGYIRKQSEWEFVTFGYVIPDNIKLAIDAFVLSKNLE